MGIRSCIISLHHGWFMGFLKTGMGSFSLAGDSMLILIFGLHAVDMHDLFFMHVLYFVSKL